MKPNIYFFEEDIKVKGLPAKSKLKTWLSAIAAKDSLLIGDLNYIFCSDQYLLSINQQYLNHSTLTDIITFENDREGDIISGDIYISIERITENAVTYKVPFVEELKRVMAHGLLHLCGYKDKTGAQQSEMRMKEEMALQLWAL